MATSRLPGPMGLLLDLDLAPERLRGPIGFGCNVNLKDTAGPLGVNDWAEFIAQARPSRSVAPASSSCACGRDLTLDELCRIYKHQKRKKCAQYLPHINATFKKYSVDNCLRKAHFLAQVGHESGELTYAAEVLPKGKKESEVYDGYKGRGLVQLTWKRNYSNYGTAAGHDFLDSHKVELEEPAWATDSAGWFWTSGASTDLNALADKNDLLAISARINGAFNGFEDRRELLAAGKTELKVSECPKSAKAADGYLAYADSETYGNRHQSLAWGLWNDPKSGKKGVKANATEKVAGYKRYLELLDAHEKAGKKETGRFGLSPAKMRSMATEGSK